MFTFTLLMFLMISQRNILFVFLLSYLTFTSNGQSINHWETAVKNTDKWLYHSGSEPDINWMQPNFDARNWTNGQGGFGYGDNDDNTILNTTSAVYIRKVFYLIDTAVIRHAILHADYDDGFVAYLNGVEIARNNIGTIGTPPKYTALADTYKEATLYSGGKPEDYPIDHVSLRKLIKEGTNSLAIQIHNQSLSSSDLSSNFFLSLGITNQSRNYRPTPDWFTAPNLGSTLPIVVISTLNNAEIKNEPKNTAHLGIIDHGMNLLTDTYNGYNGAIAIEIRGASSQSFPKKNYGFETQLADGSNNNVSILGMPSENDWILHGPYSDKSLLRNALAYHMGTSTGRYTPRTRLCEVYINSDYKGVYIMTERIKRDKNRVNIANLKPEDISGDELTGGYIVQIDRDDLSSNIDGWYNTTSPTKFYAYHDPKAEELKDVQREYIKSYITSFESAMSGAEYYWKFKNFVDVSSWVDYFLVTEIGKHIDAYKLSFYMHKVKNSDGGKLHFGPLWDFNLAFGNFDYACSPDPTGWTYQFQGTCDNSHPFWVKKMTDLSEVSNLINCRWQQLRNGALHTDSLIQFIDNRIAEMGDAPARNFEKWSILGQYVWPNDYVGNSYIEEVVFLKNWLTSRLTWMDNNMLGICETPATTTDVSRLSSIGIFPNPASSSLFVDLSDIDFMHADFYIHNSLGQEILRQETFDAIIKINLIDYSPGVYLLKIVAKSGIVYTHKFIKN
jgi:hypothetical protein